MARIPKLDAAGKFLAADVNAQIDARTKATMRADLPALAKELKIGGSGVEEVSGTVTLDATGPAIREVYATGTATVQGEALAAGDAAVFRRLNGAWSVMVVGKDTKWRAVGSAPVPPGPVTDSLALTVSGSGYAGTTRTLTASGIVTAGALYQFSIDGGGSWTNATTQNTYTTTPLTAGTFKPRVKADVNGAILTASAPDFTVSPVPSKTLPMVHTFAGAAGTTVDGDFTTTGNWPVKSPGGAVTLNMQTHGTDVGMTHTGTGAARLNPAAVTGQLGTLLVESLTTARFDASVDFANLPASGSVRFGVSMGSNNAVLLYGSGAAEAYTTSGGWKKQGATLSKVLTAGTLRITYDGTSITWYLGQDQIAQTAFSSSHTAVSVALGAYFNAAGTTFSNLKLSAL